MVARNIYITSVEGHAGKSTIALGLLDTLTHEASRVGVFRPVARSISERDYVLELLLSHDGVDLDYEQCLGVTYDDVHVDPDAALSRIVERFKAVEAQCDVVVVLGSDYTDVGSPTELSYNARIAATWARRCCSCSAANRPRLGPGAGMSWPRCSASPHRSSTPPTPSCSGSSPTGPSRS